MVWVPRLVLKIMLHKTMHQHATSKFAFSVNKRRRTKAGSGSGGLVALYGFGGNKEFLKLFLILFKPAHVLCVRAG